MLILATLLTMLQSEESDNIWSELPLVAVTKISPNRTALGPKWKPLPGLRVQDLSKLDQVPRSSVAAAEATAKRLTPLGIVSVADYSFSSSGFPLDTVTTRVFVFNDSDACRKWWEQEYQAEGWEEHYSPLKCEGMVAVRSTKTPKIALAFGNVWLTSHQVREGKQHEKLARLIIRSLTKNKRSLDIEAP